jgi:F420-non-reducing hydrogenase iron-sulfur subunit
MNSNIRISLFHCSNSISTEDISRLKTQLGTVEVKSISAPCSGKVAYEYILKSIETGSDIAIIVGCMEGECQFLQGNLRAKKRVEAINDLLAETGIGGDCIWFIHHDNNQKENLIDDLKTCILQILNEHEKVTITA